MNLTPSISIPRWVKRTALWVLSPKGGLIILLCILFVAFIAVMFYGTAEGYIGWLLGLSGNEGKNEILTFLGLSMGGVLLALQAVIANIRAKAMENAANAQTEANKNTEKGQRQERLKNAIEHLGHDSVSIRLGGAYELFHLAQDTKELRQTVLDILCSHIRRTTGEREYREKDHKLKPSEEIQSLMTLLFVQHYEVFQGLHINLQGSWLNGTNLISAGLEKADLNGAYLRNAKLFFAQLQSVDLNHAQLQGARFYSAQLQNADLGFAQSQGVDLQSARLQGANFYFAQLQGANLEFAQLQGANLRFAELQGAELSEIQLQEASLFRAQLQGVASLSEGSYSFESRIRDRVGEQSDLKGVMFIGGLTQEYFDSLEVVLTDDTSEELRAKLRAHVGKPVSYVLPKDSGAVTGIYSKREAEQWITEYNEATTAVSVDKDR